MSKRKKYDVKKPAGNSDLHGSDEPSSPAMTFNDLAVLVREHGLAGGAEDLSKSTSCTKLKSPPVIMW